ncbi:MAG: hypothetical protein GOMPHAMPRED_002684 [Gomphillus americanus]|uniref:Uncharacterized protein n=1 Tax=Gomphillus americanus TaxID=1940652 RepID=A0A8H3FCL6_9LECA|nr:MAG: hypothetical protein GOMPHAMPRED_002684 [Gomphillus americanus]
MDSTPSKRRRLTVSQSRSARDANTVPQNNEPPLGVSYRSPTKASVRRFNPNLLSGQSATNNANEGSATTRLRSGTHGLNPTALRSRIAAPRLSASPTRETSSSPSRRAQATRESIDRRRNPSLTRTGLSVSGHEEQREQDAENEIQEEAERSLMEEEKLAESVLRKAKRSRTNMAAAMPQLSREQEDPELPPTPVQLGLEKKPPPPAGILSSSPQGKGTGRKAVFKKSPLKPTSESTEQVASEASRPNAASNQTIEQFSQQAAQGTEDQADEGATDNLEFAEQRQKLENLSKQLEVLRSDVSFLLSQVRRNRGNVQQSVSHENVDRLVYFVCSIFLGNADIDRTILTAATAPEQSKSSPLKATPLATRLSTFLPFSKKPKPLPEDPLLEAELLPSYKPVESSNPLVNLQAFSPFTISSAQRLINIRSGEALLNQQQLQLSSPSPAELDLSFVLLSDTDTDTVEYLSLESITLWADAELGTWIRGQAEDTADMATIGWGSSRYLEVAKSRARCWARCYRDFPQHILSISDSQFDSATSETAKSLDMEMARHLGKPSIRFESKISKTSLVFTWHITLDWIGDTESQVSALAALPARWIQLDSQRESLAKIPEAFEKLVKKIGVYEAIKVMVGIVL